MREKLTKTFTNMHTMPLYLFEEQHQLGTPEIVCSDGTNYVYTNAIIGYDDHRQTHATGLR